MSISRCFVTGDTHHNVDIQKIDVFSRANRTLTHNDYLIILGDFGAIWYGDSRDDKILDWWENQQWTTLFIDG